MQVDSCFYSVGIGTFREIRKTHEGWLEDSWQKPHQVYISRNGMPEGKRRKLWALLWDLGRWSMFPSPQYPSLLSELCEKLCQPVLDSQVCQGACVILQPVLSCQLRVGASTQVQTISIHSTPSFSQTLASVWFDCPGSPSSMGNTLMLELELFSLLGMWMQQAQARRSKKKRTASHVAT